MKTSQFLAILIFSILAMLGPASAQSTQSQLITVIVTGINEINVDNNVTLTIATATAGTDPLPASDNTTAKLSWTTNGAITQKITVKTNLTAPAHSLKVLAQNISGTGSTPGTAAAEVTISAIDQDLITNIFKATATCDLRYSAGAPVAEGDGDDVHTIIFTITNSN